MTKLQSPNIVLISVWGPVQRLYASKNINFYPATEWVVSKMVWANFAVCVLTVYVGMSFQL
jgi:hypothetical protein